MEMNEFIKEYASFDLYDILINKPPIDLKILLESDLKLTFKGVLVTDKDKKRFLNFCENLVRNRKSDI